MRAIFFDLDGTLLNAQHELPSWNIEVVQQLTDLGLKICLASGRTYTSMAPFYRELNLDTPIISYNGAKIVYHDLSVEENPLPSTVIQELLALSREQRVHLNLYQQEIWYTENPYCSEAIDYAEKASLSPVGGDLTLISKEPCTKALFIASPERLATLAPLIIERIGDQVDLTSSMPHFLEVLASGVNKGAAITKVCEHLSIPLHETMAFGDGQNDLEMIKVVQHGVAMANAHPRLKAFANDIAPHHDVNGVARYLSHYFELST